MSIHEYVFVTISIVYGLAITRLLKKVFMVLSLDRGIKATLTDYFWSAGVIITLIWFIWIGFSIQGVDSLDYSLFVFLLITAIALYGGAEFSFPTPDRMDGSSESRLRELRVSASFILFYLASVATANLTVNDAGIGETARLVLVGAIISALIVIRPKWSGVLAPAFLLQALLFHTPLQRLVGLAP